MFIAVAVMSMLGLTGCSTPGPTHAYLASRAEDPIIDLLPGASDVPIPSYLTSDSELYGLAYDPFTDHLLLRLFPGNVVRVIDRPARKVKRGYTVQDLPPGRGDLAIRSRDRHVFFAHPTLPLVLETNLHGRTVRTIQPGTISSPPAGVAYDQKNNRLLILEHNHRSRVVTCDLAGKPIDDVTLDHAVRRGSLAYDSVAAEFYVPLLDRPVVGIFDSQGRLLRTFAATGNDAHDFVDVGQRSLLRLF